LVFPERADSTNGKISILAPVGTAVLGYRIGDTVEWKVPTGVEKVKSRRDRVSAQKQRVIILVSPETNRARQH